MSKQCERKDDSRIGVRSGTRRAGDRDLIEIVRATSLTFEWTPWSMPPTAPGSGRADGWDPRRWRAAPDVKDRRLRRIVFQSTEAGRCPRCPHGRDRRPEVRSAELQPSQQPVLIRRAPVTPLIPANRRAVPMSRPVTGDPTLLNRSYRISTLWSRLSRTRSGGHSGARSAPGVLGPSHAAQGDTVLPCAASIRRWPIQPDVADGYE